MNERRPFYLLYALVLLTGVFVTLKLFGVFTYSWVAVLSPIWLLVAGVICYVMFAIIIIAVISWDSGITKK